MKTVIAPDDFANQWQELIEDAKKIKQELLPNEMTRKEFCEKSNMSIEEADRYINKLVKQGKVEIDYRAIDGHRQKIIRII